MLTNYVIGTEKIPLSERIILKRQIPDYLSPTHSVTLCGVTLRVNLSLLTFFSINGRSVHEMSSNLYVIVPEPPNAVKISDLYSTLEASQSQVVFPLDDQLVQGHI